MAAEAKRKSEAKNNEEPPAKIGKFETTQFWSVHESVHIKNYGSHGSDKVAGFDMDDTLIRTKSGKTFPQSVDDWELWNPVVTAKLQELCNQGYKIALITNQGGVATGKVKLADLQKKIDAIQVSLQVPLLAMVLTADDIYRKPLPGSWELLLSRFNEGVSVQKLECFYCGDAAGRVPPVVKKKDFSDNDLKFALNLGLEFRTPEEFFLRQSQSYEKNTFAFDPRKLGVSPAPWPVPAWNEQTVVVIVGPPGSGKSTVATQHCGFAVRVNQDTLKTKEKCHKACQEALAAGRSVVIDNQNKTLEDRKPYIAMAKAANVKAVAFFYDVPKELCFHLNSYRMLNKNSELHRNEKVPSIVIHGFFKNKVVPTKEEGFNEVYRFGLEHFSVSPGADVKLLCSFL